MINIIRRKLDDYRASIFALTLLQAFMMAGGAEAVEIRQQGKLLAETENSHLARTFGVPAERWQPDDPNWLERSRIALVEEVSEVVDHSRSELSRLIDEMTAVDPQRVTSASEVATHLTQDEGLGSVNAGSTTRSKPRYIPKRPALDAGEGERTVVRRPLAAKAQTSLKAQAADVLPMHRVVRKARTVDADSMSPAQRISSAIAPASPPAQKQAKAIAPEIVALAASLDNSPSKIFRYVHDQITYDPKWGADTPPLGTVWEGSGTSWDQAWLLQELLQAAGVDARLEWGEVEIPTDVLMNLTGIDDPVRAGDFLTTAGLQVVLLTVGSQIVSARFPHVWVKAHLDYIPNRGARLGTPDTWIRMDPSITAHERTDGLRLDQDVPFVLDDHLLSGTELSPRDDYEAALNDHIASQGLPIANLNEAKSFNAQIAEDFPFVPGTLRAKILTTVGESETLPADYEQDVEIQVREEGGGSLLTYQTTAAAIYGQRFELVWVGANSSDQATLDLYGGVFAAPPYEVRLRPTLRLGGVEVQSGTGEIGSAEDAEIKMTLTPPGATPAEDGILTIAGWDLFAGEHGVFSLDYGRAPPELADRFALGAAAAVDPQEVEGWKLAQAAASYLHTLGGDLPHLVDLNWHRLITFNTAIFAVQRGAASTSPDGTPQTFSPGPLSLDVGAMPLAVMPVDGVQISTVPTMNLVGSQGSFREGEALTSVFGGEHLTGVTFLTRAVREGQAVTKVDATNLDAALAGADISSDAKGAVRYAVEQFGSEAWIPESQIESNTFQTTGYILLNPTSGAGGYFVTFERRFTPLDGAVTFHNPVDLDVITAPTDVIATIDAEGIESWVLSTRPTGGSGSTVIATGSGPVDNTVLGEFDPTLLLNGMHDIVLTGTDVAGQPVTGKITVVVEGQMKLGHFTLAFSDLALPLSGLDVEIVRTYDSRQRQEQLDFGQGWQLDIRQGSYRNNRPPGDGWQILNPGGLLGLPCTQTIETKSHLTTIRLSDREVYEFNLKLNQVGIMLGGCYAVASFEFVDGPLPGSTLEIVGNDEVFYANASDRLLDLDLLQLYEPSDVKLTTRDGRIFFFNLENGATRVEDTHGNALTISDAGVHDLSGRGIDFERDAEGRIVRVVDPNGQDLDYTYDASGDLVSVVDRAGGTTQFVYIADHYLEEVINPLGVRAVRTEYDDDGRMVRMIDAGGQVMEINHDLDARREVVTDRRGFVRTMEYDVRGNVIREVDPVGGVTLRSFDGEDHLLSETDPNGDTNTYTYSADNDLLTVTSPLGDTITLSDYTDLGLPQRIEDPLGNVIQMQINSQGNPTAITDPVGSVTEFAYDGQGNLTRVTDALDQITQFQLDGEGNVTRETDSLGNVTDATYDRRGNLLSATQTRTLPDGSTETLVTEMEYDDLDRLVKTTSPDGSIVRASYNLLGQVTQEVDELGRVKDYAFDDRGRLVRVDHPDGTHESFTFDGEDNLLALTDQAGRVTSYTYDGAGRLTTATYPDGSTMQQAYDPAGQVVAITDGNGHTSRFTYDAAGRRTEVTDPLDHVTRFAYDGNDQLTELTDANGHTTRYLFDALGRQVRVEHPDGTAAEVTYDALGRRTTETDEAGRVMQAAYDALGRLTSITDPLGQTLSYVYDELGNFIRQVDAEGRVTSMQYDTEGRLVRTVLPDGSAENLAYFVDSSLASLTDRKGQTRTYEYDAVGRMSKRTLADGSVETFTYSSTGRRLSATDARGVTQYAYDAMDRLEERIEPGGQRLTYLYDLVGNRTALTAQAGGQSFTTGYAYDDADRLVQVTGPGGGVYASTYDDAGNRLTTTFPNGLVDRWTRDSRDRPTQGELVDGASVLASYGYDLSPTGQRLSVSELGSTEHLFAYDAASRLVEERVEVAGVQQRSDGFTYDQVGNRLTRISQDGVDPPITVTSTYDDRDRQTTLGAASLTWDTNGNLLDGPDGDYVWDSLDRLVQITLDDGTEVRLAYDVDGNRVETTVEEPGEAPETLYHLVDVSQDLSHIVADLGPTGTVLAYYVRGAELLGLERPVDDEERYVHADALGSVRQLSDPSAQVTDAYTYTAFGELLEHQGTDGNPYGFAGEPSIAGTNLQHLRARWMAPEMGRFLSTDPFEGFQKHPMSRHRYQYADLDPVRTTDPSGMFGVVDVSIANAIRGIITGIQIDIGVSILTSPPLDPTGDISKIFILLSLASGGVGLLKGVKGLVVGAGKLAAGAVKATTKSLRGLIRSVQRVLLNAPKMRTFCFPRGTLVQTPSGAVPIEEIEAGDSVWSWDAESGGVVERTVESTSHNFTDRLYDVSFDVGETVSATGSHPFWVESFQAWVPAKLLQPGMHVRQLDGTAATVAEVTMRQVWGDVYNFIVDQEHNYFVGDLGVLVHNGGNSGTPRPGNVDVPLDDFNKAMNAALEWLEARGFKAEAPSKVKLSTDVEPVGSINGMQTKDGRVGFRVEIDGPSGAHINVWDKSAPKGTGFPHFTFPAKEKTVLKLRKLFRCH